MNNSGKNSHQQENSTKLSALQVVAKHSEGEEIVRLRDENVKLRAALALVDEQMTKKHEFYEHLVWSARGGERSISPRDETFRQKYAGDGKLLAAFERAKRELADPDTGDWNHGFNSGVMATTRLVMGLTVMEDQHMCHGYHEDEDVWSKEEEGSEEDEEEGSEEDEEESSEEDEEDDEQRPDKIQKCGKHCYWTVEQQRQHAIEEFPSLDT